MSCKLCSNLDPAAVALRKPQHPQSAFRKFDIAALLPEVDKSSRDGCGFCDLLMRIFHRYVPNSKQVLSESKRMAETREGIKCVVGINVRRGEVIPIEFSEPFQEVFATLQLYNPHGRSTLQSSPTPRADT